jgi:hypothetical protein
MLMLTARRNRWRSVRRMLVVSGMATAAVVSLAACGGSDGEGGDEAADSGKDKSLQYAKCLRDQGVDVADPKPGEQVNQFPADLPRAKVEAAQEACKKYAPQAHTEEEMAGFQQEALELAKCFRKNGVDVDDPVNGAFIPPQGEAAQSTPTFKKAMEACKQYMKGEEQDVSGR